MIYAVHKVTKEHMMWPEAGSVSRAAVVMDGRWAAVQADADGWIEWMGGVCPLPDDCRYETAHQSGDTFEGSRPQTFTAHWIGYADPVVKYRPILNAEDKEMKQEWSGEGLPPLWERVEIQVEEGNWMPGKVIVHHDGRALVYLDSEERWRYKSANADKLRPIRTDRERWIEAALDCDCEPREGMLSRRDFCGALYDAGLAKLPEQK